MRLFLGFGVREIFLLGSWAENLTSRIKQAAQPKFSQAGAYFLLESILSTPLHAELCLELARSCAGWDRGPGLLANVGLTAASSARSSWGNAPAPTAQQLLRQRNAIQAAGLPGNDG